MKTKLTLTFPVLGVVLGIGAVACSAEEPKEETSSTSSELSLSCLRDVQKAGDMKTRMNVLKSCRDKGIDIGRQDFEDDTRFDDEDDDFGDDAFGDDFFGDDFFGDDTFDDDGPSTGGTVAFRCTDGACKCTGGPKTGTACVADGTNGPSACSVVCAF